MNPALLVPSLNSETLHAPPPSLDLGWNFLATPADVDTGCMFEQLRRRRPFVRLELPRLAGSEDSDESGPVLRFEVGCSVNENELGWFGAATTGAGADCCGVGVGWVGFDAQWALEFHEVCFGGHAEGWVVGWNEDAVLEEGFDV